MNLEVFAKHDLLKNLMSSFSFCSVFLHSRDRNAKNLEGMLRTPDGI